MPATLARRQAHKPPAQVAASLAVLEQEIGGREALVAALSHAPKSRDLAYVLGLIGDPLEATTPLADLCASGGITAGELIEAYKSGEINRAQAVATSKVGAQLAQVAEDTMRRSLPQIGTCGECEGTGTFVPLPSKKNPNPEPERCKPCLGTGTRTFEGDLEHKKLALEMGRLLQKGGGGVNVQVHQQMGVSIGSAGGALEKLQAATDAILFGDNNLAPIIEAETIQSAEPEEPEAELDTDWAGNSLV